MSGDNQVREFFHALAGVLLRCWLFGFAMLFLWTGVTFFMGEVVYDLQASLFGLSRHELDVIVYCGMGLLKLLVLMFFFFPWIAIKLMLRRERLGS